MTHRIRISDDTMTRLKECAEPFMDKDPEDVIRRLLDVHERNHRRTARPVELRGRAEKEASMSLSDPTSSRAPRERGATVEIGGRQIYGATVSDLYGQALRFLVDSHENQLRGVVPFSTSAQRYLVAREPQHQRGNSFTIPVKYHGYFMEAHKDYENAIRHLRVLASKLSLSFKYVG